eukprot:jgi/Botrbrau1/15357/Bobra.0304s0001.1
MRRVHAGSHASPHYRTRRENSENAHPTGQAATCGCCLVSGGDSLAQSGMYRNVALPVAFCMTLPLIGGCLGEPTASTITSEGENVARRQVDSSGVCLDRYPAVHCTG